MTATVDQEKTGLGNYYIANRTQSHFGIICPSVPICDLDL